MLLLVVMVVATIMTAVTSGCCSGNQYPGAFRIAGLPSRVAGAATLDHLVQRNPVEIRGSRLKVSAGVHQLTDP